MPRTKKPKTNRSQAIRDFLANHPGASHSNIKEGLAKNGIKVSDSLISAVKYKKPRASGSKKRGRGVKAAGASRNGDTISIDSLLAIKDLVRKAGGVAAAEKAIAVFKQLEV
jgi:hypothetical protein